VRGGKLQGKDIVNKNLKSDEKVVKRINKHIRIISIPVRDAARDEDLRGISFAAQ
jgi:hypothetical protein